MKPAPTDIDLKRFQSLIERSERKFKNWRTESRLYESLYSNSEQAWNEIAPGGAGYPGVRSETTVVTRNTVSSNVFTSVRRLAVKYPRFSAVPLISQIERDTPQGPVVVEGTYASYAQSEILTYGFKKIEFEETLPLVLENAKIWNEGWVKIVSPSGPDASSTSVWVGAEQDGDVEFSNEGVSTLKTKIKPHTPCNSLATGPFPGIIWCDVEDIITDPDAITWDQMNVIFHRVMQPLSDMKSQTEDDPEGEPGPDGKLPQVPKYMNLDKVEPNYPYYQDLVYQRQRQGDIRNDKRFQNDTLGPVDGLVYHEGHVRIPADSEFCKKENGGTVPKTINGFCYYLCSFVEGRGEGDGADGPVLIRWQKYPADLGGFALERWKPRQKSGSQKGFSDIRNYYEANALENYFNSWLVMWHARMKPEKIVDATGIDQKSLEALNRGNFWDNVMYTPVGNKNVRDCIYITEFREPPQSVFVVLQSLRQISAEASGMSANQRGDYSGQDASATEAQIVQENTADQMAFETEGVKRFIERTAHKWFRLFVASLPATGRFEIPGSDGGFVQLDRTMLDLECAFCLEYTSFPQSLNPVETKQIQDFTMGVAQTPPNLWPVMRPWWKLMATRFSPAAMAAYREFEKIAFSGDKQPWEPDAEHLLIGEGIPVEPDPTEDFVQTIPKHRKMLQQVSSDPHFERWQQPVQSQDPRVNGKIPAQELAAHIKKSEMLAQAKGLGPALGLSGDQAGQMRKERGSGAAAGRPSQGVPLGSEMSAGSANVSEGVGAT